jgi:hypothetical protein
MNARVRFLSLFLLVAAVAIGAMILTRGNREAIVIPEPRAPIYPDLVTLPLFDFLIGTEDRTGEEGLRFSTTIGNVGEGSLRIEGRRGNRSEADWSVIQWFDEPDGQPSGTLTGANLVFGGHGHEHWHMKFGAAYRLFPADGEGELASQTKAGYCWFDQVRLEPEVPGSPVDRVHLPASCGEIDATTIDMGMSVGWSDPYFWQLEDQSVEITGLPDGRYRLTAVADPDDFLVESDESNNATWVELQIGTNDEGLRTVEVVDSAGG